jgi:hypothetical protein
MTSSNEDGEEDNEESSTGSIGTLSWSQQYDARGPDTTTAFLPRFYFYLSRGLAEPSSNSTGGDPPSQLESAGSAPNPPWFV